MIRDIQQWIREELFDQVPVSICVIDSGFRIVHANDQFAKAYGEWRNQRCFNVYKGRTERCDDCDAVRTFADGQMREREERGIERDGQPTHYLVRLFAFQQPDGDIPYVIEMSTNITELKRLQREKLEAERLAAVGQTVAGLAHGIKNLIMGLEGGMYVVNSGLRRGDNERLLKGWQMLEEDIARISSFAMEFLDFARGRKPVVRMLQPNNVAREVIKRFNKRATRSGVDLRPVLQHDLPEVPMDREGLNVCLTNLVLNAIDACLMSSQEKREVVLSSYLRDDVVVFEVTDNGCGMDYDIKQRVFTSFFSTKASGKGTGLGLLTTRKIVQEHGGSVTVDSTEGEGSTFRLEFPLNRLPRPDNPASE